MWQIASQMFLCLLLAGLIGAVAGWALAALLGRDRVARLEEPPRGVAALERELGLATQRGHRGRGGPGTPLRRSRRSPGPHAGARAPQAERRGSHPGGRGSPDGR